MINDVCTSEDLPHHISRSPDCNTSCTESEALEFFQKIMTELKEMRQMSDFQKISELFERLNQGYHDFEGHKVAISNELMKQHYVAILTTYITTFHELGYTSSDDVWSSTVHSFGSLWNYSDASQEIANKILNTKLPKLLMENVINSVSFENTEISDGYLLKASLSVIHNVVRLHNKHSVFREVEFKRILVYMVQRNDSNDIGILSMLILACLVDENELDLLVEGENTIKIIIKIIRLALENDSKEINGFAIWELLNGLKYIVANDSMKKMIFRENGIDLIFGIIKEPSCEEDITQCLGVLWNLCFDQKMRTTLLTEFDLRNVIKAFEHHKNPETRKCYDGIIWLINDIAEHKQLLKSKNIFDQKTSIIENKFDVFLSYCWANKSTILKIHDELVKSHIHVWIDVDQMKGSTLDAMSDGIESSKMFIMAVSEGYSTSPNCRMEAEYALKLRKPIIPIVLESKYKPKNWLGFIVGSKTYYEFNARRTFSESFRGLMNNINEHMGSVEPSVVPKIVTNVENDIVDSPVIKTTKTETGLKIYNWSEKDVEDWLIKNGLDNFKTEFSLVNGKLLTSMINMNSKSPNYLYETLRNEYGMKLNDILKLNLAINELDL